ncbi:MAG: O-antigen ligase family protein [Pirellulales bacterium]|nr:O-antigen ligase family protein [Pirellulales bacterium]
MTHDKSFAGPRIALATGYAGSNPYAAPQSLGFMPAARQRLQGAWQQAQSFYVHPLPLWVFYILYFLTTCNLIAVLTRMQRFVGTGERQMQLFPFVVAGAFAIIFFFTKERAKGQYFWWAWTYWILYTLFGFAGEQQLTMLSPVYISQGIVKSWISVIGFPWMMFRVISYDKSQRILWILMACMVLGFAVMVLQILGLEAVDYFSVEKGRGSGLWINPNSTGFMVTMCFFFSFLYKGKYQWLMWGLRGMMLLMVMLTLSRTAFLGIVMGSIVASISTGKVGRAVAAGAGIFSILLGFLYFGVLVEQGVIPIESKSVKTRINSISGIITGRFTEENAMDNRTDLWQLHSQRIMDNNPILGLGHGSMDGGMEGMNRDFLSPHNEFIYLWGNSGAIALLVYLIFLTVIVYQAYTIPDISIRGPLMGAITMLFMTEMFGHSLFANHYTGPIMAVLAYYLYYGHQFGRRGANIPLYRTPPVNRGVPVYASQSPNPPVPPRGSAPQAPTAAPVPNANASPA